MAIERGSNSGFSQEESRTACFTMLNDALPTSDEAFARVQKPLASCLAMTYAKGWPSPKQFAVGIPPSTPRWV